MEDTGHLCIHVCMHMHIYARKYIYAYMHLRTRVVCTYMYVYMYIHTCICVLVFVHICTFICIYKILVKWERRTMALGGNAFVCIHTKRLYLCMHTCICVLALFVYVCMYDRQTRIDAYLSIRVCVHVRIHYMRIYEYVCTYMYLWMHHGCIIHHTELDTEKELAWMDRKKTYIYRKRRIKEIHLICAVCCSVLQCVAVCCSVLQCDCCSVKRELHI